MNALEIKKFRKKHNLTQERLAEIAGVTVRAVQSWEQDKRNISQSAIKLLQEYGKKPENIPDKQVRMLAVECIQNWDELMETETFKLAVYREIGRILNVEFDEILKNGIKGVLKK